MATISMMMELMMVNVQVEKEYGSRLALESPHPGRLKSAQVIMIMMMRVAMFMIMTIMFMRMTMTMMFMRMTMTMMFMRMTMMTTREAVSHCTGAETHFLVTSRLLSYQRFSLSIPHICSFLYTGKIFQAKILHPKARKLRRIEFRDKIA